MADNLKNKLWDYFVKGLVILVPLIITLIVLSFAIGFIRNLIGPFSGLVGSFIGQSVPSYVTQSIAVGILLGIIFTVGFLTELFPTGQKITDLCHAIVEEIPGIGSFYASFRKMSETMIEGKHSFRDVMVAEYPSEGCYTLAFVTSRSSEKMDKLLDESTITVFIPMAPNPFMGGFVTNLPEDRLHDTDMTVQEGAKALITSGVTLRDDTSEDSIELEEELQELQEMIGEES